jgi:hypothetical protein
MPLPLPPELAMPPPLQPGLTMPPPHKLFLLLPPPHPRPRSAVSLAHGALDLSRRRARSGPWLRRGRPDRQRRESTLRRCSPRASAAQSSHRPGIPRQPLGSRSFGGPCTKKRNEAHVLLLLFSSPAHHRLLFIFFFLPIHSHSRGRE